MTECTKCGIDKEDIQKDLNDLTKLVKTLSDYIEKNDKDEIKQWSGTLGDMVRKMDEEKAL